MSDRTAASAGFVVAGLALAAALLDGAGLLAVPPALALLGFGLRRYGRLDRAVGAPIAGVASLATAAGTALAPAVRGAGAPPGAALGVVAAGGLLAVALAYADWRGVGRDRLGRMARATTTATILGLAGIAAIVLWTVVLATVLRPILGGNIGPQAGTTLSTVALGFGTGTVVLFYLEGSDRGVEFLDIRRPGLRDLAYVAAGVIVILGLNIGLEMAFRTLGIESAQHSVIRTARGDPEILLVLVPLSYLVIGPGEELLYRNVVQKSLYGAFSRPGAVVVASVIFAAVHLFAYTNPEGTLVSTLATLAVVFVLSLVLGTVYERTGTVVVSALVHGSFNAIAFAVTYVQLIGG